MCIRDRTAALQEVIATMDTFESESDKKMKLAKVCLLYTSHPIIKTGLAFPTFTVFPSPSTNGSPL